MVYIWSSIWRNLVKFLNIVSIWLVLNGNLFRLTCISLNTNDIENFFMCWFAIYIIYSIKYLLLILPVIILCSVFFSFWFNTWCYISQVKNPCQQIYSLILWLFFPLCSIFGRTKVVFECNQIYQCFLCISAFCVLKYFM